MKRESSSRLMSAVLVLLAAGATSVWAQGANNSLLRLDRTRYQPNPAGGDCLFVTVSDPDQNRIPTVSESVTVGLVGYKPGTGVAGDIEDLTLHETGPGTG